MQDVYPSDLVNGAIPVVFVVNAVDDRYDTSSWSTTKSEELDHLRRNRQQQQEDEAQPKEGSNTSEGMGTTAHHSSGPFDLFIDALSFVCNKDYEYVDRWNLHHNHTSAALAAVPERERADSAPADLLLGQQHPLEHTANEFYNRGEIISGEESSSDDEQHVYNNDEDETRRISHGFASEMRKRIHYINRGGKSKEQQQKSHQQQHRIMEEDLHLQQPSTTPTTPTFFDRVRIIPVSKRHAFPPSKDPTGINNSNTSMNNQQQQRYYGTTHDVSTTSGKQPVEHYLLDKISPNPFSLRRKQLQIDKAITHDQNNTTNRPSTTTSSHVDVYPPTRRTSASSTGEGGQYYNKQLNHNVGIIPVDWLEKHAQWLPSVVLIATVLDLNLPQSKRVERDVQLGEIIDNLRSSLAPKRECRIHLACLVTNHEHLRTVQQKHLATSQQLTFVRSQCRLSPSNITILHFPGDLVVVSEQQQQPLSSLVFQLPHQQQPTSSTNINDVSSSLTSLALKQLHRTVRDLSMSYYLSAARRLKRKIATLHAYNNNNNNASGNAINFNLLPFVIRCQFKIGIYYEFQQKLDRCVKHLSEAYNAVELYYKYVANQQRQALSILQEQISYYNQQQQKQSQLQQVLEDEECGSIGAVPNNGNNTYSSSYADLTTPVTPQRRTTNAKIQSPSTNTDDGVEVALIAGSPPPTAITEVDRDDLLLLQQQINLFTLSDMAYQCRGVADWINFKLMKYTFQYSSSPYHSSNITQQQATNNNVEKALTADIKGGGAGLVHATMQWRRHCQIFLSTQYYYIYDNDLSPNNYPGLFQPSWWHSFYVEHQRLAMAELADHYPLRLNNTNSTYFSTELLLLSNSWRLYQSAAEATLQTYKLLELEKKKQNITDQRNQGVGISSQQHHSPNQYVGGMDPDTLKNQFHIELGKQRYESAIRYLERAVALFYHLDGINNTSWYDCTAIDYRKGRSVAPVHYLLGSLIVNDTRPGDRGSNRIGTNSIGLDNAIKHLHHALRIITGWSSLEAAIVKSLIRCYSMLTERGISWNDDEAVLVNSLAFLLRPDIFRFLQPIEIKQLRDGLFSGKQKPRCFSLPWPREDRKRAPLDFSLTFLEDACHAVAGDRVKACLSVTSRCSFPLVIQSLEIVLTSYESNHVLTAIVPKKDEEKIRIQLLPRKSLLLNVAFQLPHVQPESSLDLHSPSLSRSSKTKTAGLSRSGGAVLTAQKNSSSSPTQAVFSGKSLYCREVSVLLTPAVCEESPRSGSAVNLIFPLSRIDMSKNSPDALVASKHGKHHPDDDNYIMTAWSRPLSVPFYRGPSRLRILPPTPSLHISDLTAIQTNSKAMEGTVNRIYLKLKAGEMEQCKNISMKIIALQTSSLPDSMMVIETDAQVSPVRAQTNLVPSGWRLRNFEEVTPVCSELRPGEDTFVIIDFFRPLPHAPYKVSNPSLLEPSETHYELEFTYSQHRFGNFDSKGDQVMLRYAGTLRWFPPINVQFKVIPDMNERCFPRGNPRSSILMISHDINSSGTESEGTAADSDISTVRRGNLHSNISASHKINSTESERDEFAADGDLVTVRGSLDLSQSQNTLVADVLSINCETKGAHDKACKLELLSSSGSIGLATGELLSPPSGKSRHFINPTCVIGFSYTVRPKLNDGVEEALLHLGILKIEWTPIPLFLQLDETSLKHKHGPLALDGLAAIRFLGPLCKVEVVPFDAGILSFREIAKVALPFEVRYWIRNNTPLYQNLSVSMSDADTSSENPGINPYDGILVSGFVNGDIVLAPHEVTVVGYSALATKSGKTSLPVLAISSSRYQSWVIKDSHPNPRQIYVLP